jgi:hypothetical protein
LSSREKYFYHIARKEFIEVPNYDESDLPIRSPWVDGRDVEPTIVFNGQGYYGLAYRATNGFIATDAVAFNNNGKRFQYKTLKGFKSAHQGFDRRDYVSLEFTVGEGVGFTQPSKRCLALVDTAGILSLNGNPVVYQDQQSVGNYTLLRLDAYGTFYYVYSFDKKAFLINPYASGTEADSKYKFNIVMNAHRNKDVVILKPSDESVTSEEWFKVWQKYNDQMPIEEEGYINVNLSNIYNSGNYVQAEFLSDSDSAETQQAVNEVVNISFRDIKLMTESVLRKILEKC